MSSCWTDAVPSRSECPEAQVSNAQQLCYATSLVEVVAAGAHVPTHLPANAGLGTCVWQKKGCFPPRAVSLYTRTPAIPQTRTHPLGMYMGRGAVSPRYGFA